MKVVIIEDEVPAANRLANLVKAQNTQVEIVAMLDSVETAVQWFSSMPAADLVFMDIQLADGLSFDIFRQIEVNTPVIFTTAFDQYMLRAFKVNSIDYLLKPIDEKDLGQAMLKYQKLFAEKTEAFTTRLLQAVKEIQSVGFAERLLVKRGQQMSYVKTQSVAYAYADGKLCRAVDFQGNKYLLETTLSQLEEKLQPNKFYRINRQLLVNIDAVVKVYNWLGGRLKLELSLPAEAETLVSRERVNGFKEWLGE
jgi:DNA-binding LytR/AlgR family response regulator